jgi:hypothetical protein
LLPRPARRGRRPGRSLRSVALHGPSPGRARVVTPAAPFGAGPALAARALSRADGSPVSPRVGLGTPFGGAGGSPPRSAVDRSGRVASGGGRWRRRPARFEATVAALLVTSLVRATADAPGAWALVADRIPPSGLRFAHPLFGLGARRGHSAWGGVLWSGAFARANAGADGAAPVGGFAEDAPSLAERSAACRFPCFRGYSWRRRSAWRPGHRRGAHHSGSQVSFQDGARIENPRAGHISSHVIRPEAGS